MDKGTFEYEIRKDVRNNPIVREVDERRQRELWQSLGIGVVLVLVLLFSAWQHFELLRHGYRLEQMQRERAAESDINRHLRLEMETLRAPQRIEKLATERLGMVAPDDDEAIVLERVAPPSAARASRVVACTVTGGFAWPFRLILHWRPTLEQPPARGGGRARRCGSLAIEARLVVPAGRAARRSGGARRAAADAHGRSAGQARRDLRSQRPPARLQRRRRHDLRGADRDRRCRQDRRPRSASALDDCTREDRERSCVERLGAAAAVRLRAPARRRRCRRSASRRSSSRASASCKESRRFYPNRELAAHLLGYVGVDNVGLGGLEATYDKTVRGREGKLLVQTDARRHAFSRLERPPTAGGSLELTIDEHLQHIAERELRAGVEARARRRRHGGRHGSAHRRDPRDGELADVQPERVQRGAENAARRNRAVQDLYEPGSTFKIVTASAALEEKVMTPDELIDVSAGDDPLRQPRRSTTCIDYGVLSFTDVIVKSSNVGAIKVGLKLGAERMGLYVRRFGFGRPIVAGFSGREPGHRLGAVEAERQRAGVGVDGLPGRRDAAADGGGGQRRRQRRHAVRAARRPRDRQRRRSARWSTPKVVRRAIIPRPRRR